MKQAKEGVKVPKKAKIQVWVEILIER